MIKKSFIKAITVTVIALFAVVSSTHAAVLLSNFGTDILTDDLQGGWYGHYTSATSTVTAYDSAGAGISHFPVTGWNLTGLNKLSLTASVTANPLSTFSIILEDSAGKQVTSDFYWSSFGASPTTIISTLNTAPVGFNFNDVIGWYLYTDGTSGNAITVTFSDLTATAVPEPSAIMLLGAAMSGLALCRVARRKA